MEELNTQCSCGATEKFLRKKGGATGLYCGNCSKWFKWVGKKDVDKYKQRGFRVHAENYSPNNLGNQQQQNYPTQHQQQEYPSTTQSNNQEFLHKYAQPYNNVPPHPYDTHNHNHQEDTLPEFNSFEEEEDLYTEDTYHPTNSLNKPSDYRKPKHDEGICLTHINGVVEALNKSNKVTATIFDGVLNIKNLDGTKLYGSFSVKYCPNCGEPI